MKTIKPTKIGTEKSSMNEKLTSAEMGKLWATYMGNSMAICVISCYLQHVEDHDIKSLLEDALNLSTELLEMTKEIFEKENFPIPKGFSIEKDVNFNAPRLFQDEFYPHYLKYTAKAGLSIYSIAIPIVYRQDVKELFTYCLSSTMKLMEQIKEILMNKGLSDKPPIIPVPDEVMLGQENFLNGFFGSIRPLHVLEVTHFFDNIENNVTSKALIMAFAQVAVDKKIRKLLVKGHDMTAANIESYMQKLHEENLPTPKYLDDLVTTSTLPPFSDKLMLFHKMDMFSMKMRAFGNSIAVNGRHDVGLLYTRSLMKIGNFVEDAARIMIEKKWFESAPFAVDRKSLASKQKDHT
jgi:Protein of unknown function (DUF3231)